MAAKPKITRLELAIPGDMRFVNVTEATVAGSFNVEVKQASDTKSILVQVDKTQRTEQYAPLWAFGDDGGVPKMPFLGAGDHVVTLTPFEKADAKGAKGTPIVIRVRVLPPMKHRFTLDLNLDGGDVVDVTDPAARRLIKKIQLEA
ncbi:MAG TPA: hypothetical protein VGN72_14500 [Tepidisphaeraceae bacterium]|jgi:hypothetical protein|nr:hypothetical protein [Tepidisphaeraceae bacterium]